MNVDDAYRRCLDTARRHYENFPVASWLLPASMRHHVAAIYAFARTADDFADEGDRSPGERLALLAAWRRRLQDACEAVPQAVVGDGEPADAEAIFIALGESIRRLQLPKTLFEDLLSAFEQDVTVSRYDSWPDLLAYCRLSANPIGRLLLRIGGRVDDRLDRGSDAICTALQLINFWQDVALDAAKGRCYLPEAVRRAHGVGAVTPDVMTSREWREAMTDVAARTRALFAEGRYLPGAIGGRLGLQVRATWLGGMRILDRLERAGFDVCAARPVLGPRDMAWMAVRLVG
jgi:squalene synthase HpnC